MTLNILAMLAPVSDIAIVLYFRKLLSPNSEEKVSFWPYYLTRGKRFAVVES
jgi:hypothetical protein